MRLEDGDDVAFWEVKAEGLHGDFEFVVVDLFVFIEVEEAKLWFPLSISTSLESILSGS